MRIYLHKNYRGVLTDEQWLLEGVHDVDNALGAYLVENGHARVVVTNGEAQSDAIATALVTGKLNKEDDPVSILKAVSIDTPSKEKNFHDKLMEASGRPRMLTQAERNVLIARYAELNDNVAPPPNIGDETLQRRVAELEANDTSDTNG